MSRTKIENVISILPQLTDFGIGVYQSGRGLSQEEYQEQLKQSQVSLLDNTEEFEKVCIWLQQIQKIKSINKNRSSYGLKHIAEKDIGYITNGIFIAAAVHSGFKYKIHHGSPNVTFNMSEKSIKRLLGYDSGRRKSWVQDNKETTTPEQKR